MTAIYQSARKWISELWSICHEKGFNAAALYTLIFTSICIGINYSIDFNDKILESTFGKPESFFWYILFYAFAFYGTAIPIAFISKDTAYLKRSDFWIKSFVCIALLGFTSAFYFHSEFIQSFKSRSERYFLFKVLSQFRRPLIFTLPFLILYLIYDRKQKNWYGFKLKGFNPKIYLILALTVLPLAFAASFSESFLKAYPRFKFWALQYPIFGLNSWQATSIFEFFYGAEFIYVEWVFRGFLALGLYWIMGPKAILPMVTAYAFLHFGKPMGETIGSVAGGFILGLLVIKSGNIWGGVLLHWAMAFSMEIAAIAQYFIRN